MNPMGSIAKNMAKNSLNGMKDSMMSQGGQYSTIKWEEFNYPPLLKLIHYDLNELNEPHKSLVKKMHISSILVFVATLIGLFGNMLQVFMASAPAIRIFYAFMNLVMFNPAALYVFYKGYRGIVMDESQLRFYKILQGILGLGWFMFSILALGAFDGWVRVSQLFSSGGAVPGILAFIESVVYLLNSLLALYCVYATHKFDGKATDDNVESV